MTLNLGMIVGAVLAIVIVWFILEGLVRGAAALNIPVHPILLVLKWVVFGVFCVIAIAWAFGISIPFVNVTM